MTLVMIGSVAGVLLAFANLGALLAFAPADIPRLNEVTIDLRVLGGTAAVSLLMGRDLRNGTDVSS